MTDATTSTNPARFVDIHLLQTVPYANLNRDDLGEPKRLRYGDADRTRVSSQCWKRATRLAIEAELGDHAARTRRVPLDVAERLRDTGWPVDLAALAGEQLADAVGLALEKNKDGITAVLLFLPEAAIDELADLARAHREPLAAVLAARGTAKKKTEKKDRKAAAVLPEQDVRALLSARNAVINLFGRMLAELPGGQVDGAVQVAHAFTTHGTDGEADFFTAVDDHLPADETGSGHMNTAAFSAGVFYRFATIDIAGLASNLGGDLAAAATLTRAFLRAFALSMPTGKNNATAPHTRPDLAYLAVRSDRPLSLAGAFESPVRAASDGGWAAPSRSALAEYAALMHTVWDDDGLVHHAHAGIEPKPLHGLGDRAPSFGALLDSTITASFPNGAALVKS